MPRSADEFLCMDGGCRAAYDHDGPCKYDPFWMRPWFPCSLILGLVLLVGGCATGNSYRYSAACVAKGGTPYPGYGFNYSLCVWGRTEDKP